MNIFIYFAIVFCGCGGVITYVQNSFDTHFEGMKDLITYEFLQPVVNEYTHYAENGITYGIICIVIFAALTVAFRVIKKNKQ